MARARNKIKSDGRESGISVDKGAVDFVELQL